MPVIAQAVVYFAIIFGLSIALHHLVELRGIAVAKRLIARRAYPLSPPLNARFLARDQ